MGKSLDFVKQRISSGQCHGMENNEYKSMIEQNTQEMFNDFGFFVNGETQKIVKCKTQKWDFIFNIVVQYDPNANFDYFTMLRCTCDGTFAFFRDLMAGCLNRIISFNTYGINKGYPKDFNGKFVVYTVGDFVLAEEFGERFATPEKPWVQSRLTAMLPIKFDVVDDWRTK